MVHGLIDPAQSARCNLERDNCRAELLSHRVAIAAPGTRLLHTRWQIDQPKRFIDTGGAPRIRRSARVEISLGQRCRSFRAARVPVPNQRAACDIESADNAQGGSEDRSSTWPPITTRLLAMVGADVTR